jgi:hypothetical protein
MTGWDDFSFEMERLPLDTDTADRLLAGTVPPQDAPPGYAPVAAFLAAARAAEIGAGNSGTEAVWTVLGDVHSSRAKPTKSPGRFSVHRVKLAAALATAALACTTGLAFAGSLPGAAQDVASAMLAKAGITVPGPDENAGTHPSIRGNSSSQASHTTAKPTSAPESDGQGKGAEISQLATTTDLTGVDKGAAISTLASGGHSQAGQNGQATAEHGSASANTAASAGAATADAASSGHSGAGADNADGHSHQP